MSILSQTVGLSRYVVDGKLEGPVIETVTEGLKKFAFTEDEVSDKTVGWTSLHSPYKPDFEASSFIFGSFFIFSIRTDKKTIPAKIVKKQMVIETEKRLEKTGREYLSRNEKQLLKEEVIQALSDRIPAVPNIYDLVWNYEESKLWLTTTQKSANEELEILFSKSFGLMLIRLFPYSQAHLMTDISDAEKDLIAKLTPTVFTV